MTTNEDLDRLLSALLIDEPRSTSSHVTPERLAEYRSHKLSEEGHEEIQKHLVECRPCADLLLELRRFAEPCPELPPSAREAIWASFEDLDDKGPSATAEDSPRASDSIFLPRHPWWKSSAGAAAATFLLTTLGLGAWLIQSRHELALRSRPQVNLPVQDLILLELRSETAFVPPPSSRAQVVELGPGVEGTVLILTPRELLAAGPYTLEIDQDGRRRWRSGTVIPGEHENFTVSLPRGFLPAGTYRLRLFGGRRPVAEVLFEIRYL